jgi:hypothetical protein
MVDEWRVTNNGHSLSVELDTFNIKSQQMEKVCFQIMYGQAFKLGEFLMKSGKDLSKEK